MPAENKIPEPFQFNPLKHHLSYIREFVALKIENEAVNDPDNLIKELKHIGTSVMDIYTGDLQMNEIFKEVKEFLNTKRLGSLKHFAAWAGAGHFDFKIISLSDGSQWTLKFHKDELKYVHLFPARLSPHSFRVKANTLKSAIMYCVLIGKDYITRTDLNHARGLSGLSPVKDPAEAEAITEMIEILRT